MARLARVVLPGVPHHITQRGVRSMNIFSGDADRDYYLELVHKATAEFGLTILSYCLMSNHVHLLVIPESETSLSLGIGMIHRHYSRMVNFREKPGTFYFRAGFFMPTRQQASFCRL